MTKSAPKEQSVSVDEAAASASPYSQLGDMPAALIAAAGEAVLVMAVYRDQLALGWIVLAHLLIVAGLGVWLVGRGRDGHDISYGLLTAIATLSTGPIGAIGAVIAIAASGVRPEPSHLLEEWYERISHSTRVDDVTRQCEMVTNGRAIGWSGEAPMSFSAVMAHGTPAQKQSALGLVARKFHPDYLPALQDALKCDEPAIRVQAAAVAAHVRGQLKDCLFELIGEAPAALKGSRSALRLALRIEQCLSSSLLDDKDRAAGRKAVDRLYDRSIDALEFKLPGGSGAGLLPGPGGLAASSFDEEREREELTRAYEALLLRRGRFAEFRALRNQVPRDEPPGGGSGARRPAPVGAAVRDLGK